MKKPLNQVLCEVMSQVQQSILLSRRILSPEDITQGLAMGGGLLLGSRFLQSVAVKTIPGAPWVPFESGLLSLAV